MKKNVTGRRRRLLDRKRKKREERKKLQKVAAQRGQSAGGRVRRALKWPVLETLVNADWRETGLVTVLVARGSEDRITCGSYLADLKCLGIKDAAVHGELGPLRYSQLKSGWDRTHPMVACEPPLARKIVDTAVAYARDLGFSPHPDYVLAKELLADIDGDECHEDVPCGSEGMPLYVQGPHDDCWKIIEQLERRCGPDGFHFILVAGDFQADSDLDLEFDSDSAEPLRVI